MNIVESTRQYETWLSTQTTLVRADLKLKHAHLREGAFPFLRGTFYRWMQLFPEVCKEAARAPRVLAVGDLHVENFGTWRDAEGRLIWGVNDVDEAAPLPYTQDLVRLATSAWLAGKAGHLGLNARTAAQALLEGYRDALLAGGRPFVLSEQHVWLRQIAESKLRDPVIFWGKMRSLRRAGDRAPSEVVEILHGLMPHPDLPFVVLKRVAGIGSLGHMRFVALADWQGGWIAREAKRLVPSSVAWVEGRAHDGLHCGQILRSAMRARDPFVAERDGWMLRRLSPSCSRIELVQLPAKRDESVLLYAMGWETANIHLGTTHAAKRILQDLDRRGGSWLRKSAKEMARVTLAEWKEWAKA